MKRVIPATEDYVSNTITSSYGRGGVAARNLYYCCRYPKAAVLEITRVYEKEDCDTEDRERIIMHHYREAGRPWCKELNKPCVAPTWGVIYIERV